MAVLMEYDKNASVVKEPKILKLLSINIYWARERIIPYINTVSSDLNEEQKMAVDQVIGQIANHTNAKYTHEADLQQRNICKLIDINNEWNKDNIPIPGVVIKEVSNILLKVTKQPDLYPTNRESIQLQFDLEDRSYLEFEIFKDKVVCMVVPKRIYSNAYFPKVDFGNYDEINRIIGDFHGIK